MPKESALSMIGGVTLGNEGSVRDWLRHGTLNVTQGKNWDGSGAMGPWLVPFTGPEQIVDVHLRDLKWGGPAMMDV